VKLVVKGLASVFLLAAVLPPALFARSAGPPIFSSGVPTALDLNGATCVRCHSTYQTVNPDGPEHLRVEAFHYKPGQRQTIRVTVSHPEAVRWGFQLTARLAADFTKRAGKFVLAPLIRVQCSDVVPNGRDVTPTEPCPVEAQEFASHNASSTQLGSNGTSTWAVEWDPPDTDIGDVVFFASGNASNGNFNNQGDRIYNNGPAGFRIEASGRTCPNTKTPMLRTTTNAASFRPDLAMNTLVSILGSDFATSGTQRVAGAADFGTGRFPTELACVAVELDGSKDLRLPIFYVQNDQINAQLPTGVTTGTHQYRVIVNPDRPNQMVSDAGTLTVTNYASAFFTFDGKSIKGRFTDGVIVADPSLVPGARTVKAGDILQLYATGLGPTDPVWQAGEFPDRPSPVRDPFSVTVGGTVLAAADVLYAGAAPGMISGFYQINIRVPASVAEGEIPVTMSIGGVSSPAGTTIPVRR
jgi:uncharacterized protein (TIGR03437 family)